MSTRLNQLLAIKKGANTLATTVLTRLHRITQKGDALNGHSRTFKSLADDGPQYPPDNKSVQTSANDVLAEARAAWTDQIDISAKIDFTNIHAKADVKVDGNVLIADAPVTLLLTLETRLNEMQKLVSSIVELDPNETWTLDSATGYYKSSETLTHKTAKKQVPIILAQATIEHPAQTQLITEDLLVGHWHQTKISGALPRPEKKALLEKIEKVSRAVKKAREEANMTTCSHTRSVGDSLFGYLLG